MNCNLCLKDSSHILLLSVDISRYNGERKLVSERVDRLLLGSGLFGIYNLSACYKLISDFDGWRLLYIVCLTLLRIEPKT